MDIGWHITQRMLERVRIVCEKLARHTRGKLLINRTKYYKDNQDSPKHTEYPSLECKPDAWDSYGNEFDLVLFIDNNNCSDSGLVLCQTSNRAIPNNQ